MRLNGEAPSAESPELMLRHLFLIYDTWLLAFYAQIVSSIDHTKKATGASASVVISYRKTIEVCILGRFFDNGLVVLKLRLGHSISIIFWSVATFFTIPTTHGHILIDP